VEAFVGDLPPRLGRILYMACVDPHLISGADIIVDVNDEALGCLEDVQKAYLRRTLGLGQYSMLAPLFTEMGLVPLRYRRLTIALRYLKYLVGLPMTHYARLALEDSFKLYSQDKPGYWMDLVYALQGLRFPIQLPPLPEINGETCDNLAKAVHAVGMKHLATDTDASTRLYLLHGRREPLEEEPPKAVTSILRHYLILVENAHHRKALTRMLLSQHPLAVEKLRYPRRYHDEPVPRELRKCRFLCDQVETVEHALFFCNGSEDLREKRRVFKLGVSTKVPEVLAINPWNATEVLRKLVFERETVCQLAKYVHRVFAIFETVAIKWPDGY
jgi:hypothetical protein